MTLEKRSQVSIRIRACSSQSLLSGAQERAQHTLLRALHQAFLRKHAPPGLTCTHARVKIHGTLSSRWWDRLCKVYFKDCQSGAKGIIERCLRSKRLRPCPLCFNNNTYKALTTFQIVLSALCISIPVVFLLCQMGTIFILHPPHLFFLTYEELRHLPQVSLVKACSLNPRSLAQRLGF